MKHTCKTCEWFKKDKQHRSGRNGVCHRYPTKEDKYDSDWCGEHSALRPQVIQTDGKGFADAVVDVFSRWQTKEER